MINSTKISTNANGDTTLVSGVANRKIRVMGFTIVAAGAVVAKFTFGTGGVSATDLTGAMTMATGVPISPPVFGEAFHGRGGLFEADTGKDLILNLGSGVQVSGWVNWILTGD